MRSLLAALLLLVLVPVAAQRGVGLLEAAAWQRADAVARSRAGDVTFAVIDTQGHIHGKRYTTPVRGVSTIKSLLLLTFLRQSSVRHRSLTAAEKSLLDRMIRYSDNGAASTMIGRLGESADRGRGASHRDALVPAHPRLLGPLADQRPRPGGAVPAPRPEPSEAASHVRAAAVLDHRLLPAVGRPARARRTGSACCSRAAGATAPARPTHQGARLERGGVTLGLGITTFGNSGTEYGATTIERVTKALLRPQPCAS